ncbi:MAG: hypothetical protein RL641_479, partial [Candidatus Parcubacteria bacterium]
MYKKVVIFTCLVIVVATLGYITFFQSEPSTQLPTQNTEAVAPVAQEVSNVLTTSPVGPTTEGGFTIILPTPPKTKAINKPATVTTSSNNSASNSTQPSSNTTQQTNTPTLPAEQSNAQTGTDP